MIPKLNLDDFDYYLPEKAIAQYPLDERDKSKLLYANPNTDVIRHLIFYQLPEIIEPNSLLVLNDTKVFSARLFFRKSTGGKVEIFCERPIEPSEDYNFVLYNAKSPIVWECIVGGSRIRDGLVLEKEFELKSKKGLLRAKIREKTRGLALVEFEWDIDCCFYEILQVIGNTPLPPYVKREAQNIDKEKYQTIYAQKIGSIAAPTAGFHFTDEILKKLEDKNTNIVRLTLHIGLGTFKPVEVQDISKHQMHFEDIFIEKESIAEILNYIKREGTGNIIAVGTTSLRILESLYWWAVKLDYEKKNNSKKEIYLEKEEPYKFIQENHFLSVYDAFEFLYDLCQNDKINSLRGRTQLYVVPGYKFQVVDKLITNFHLPKSTLIMLVSAFLGDKFWRKVYEEALANGYRFLSYGDSSFLVRNEEH